VYPTPYELHFSIAHLKRYEENPKAYAEHFHGTDQDLAAHVAIINRYGVPLYGPAVDQVFGEVSKAVYADSLLLFYAESWRSIFYLRLRAGAFLYANF
jgi:streptomycin 3"-adenylyltransferase